MLSRFDKWIATCDALILLASLGAALLLPVFFMLPFADEWMRMNYLAQHSPWEMTVMHSETWVVRPSADIVLAWASLQTTWRALGVQVTPSAFLARFRTPYVLWVLTTLALLYLLARVLSDKRNTSIAWGVACACMWVCLWSSDGLGHGFYWADGYANVVVPFCAMVLGMALWTRGGHARAPAALCLVFAALGHEVLCMYSLGFLSLELLFGLRLRRGSRLRWAACAGLVLGLLLVLYAQGFSAGPAFRSQVYYDRTHIRYNFVGAWQAVQQIDPWRTALALIVVWMLLAIYRPWLHGPIGRAAQSAKAQRLRWSLLAGGTWLTSLVPLASVGLKKSTIQVSAYSVDTELFVVLASVLSYPLLDTHLRRLFAPYRRTIRSGLPVMLGLALLSPNLADFRSAVSDFSRLRADGRVYMRTLFEGRGQRVTVHRPCHPFLKQPNNNTMRSAKEYFGNAHVREVQCK